MAASGRDPTLRFEAVPYQAEGGYNLPGLLLALALSLAGGVIAGAVAAWIGQWFYLILIFPVGIAVIVGGCGAFGAKWGTMRNPALGMFVGIVGGSVAVAAMHYFEFRSFLVEAEKINPGALGLQFSLIAFMQFIDESARAGVQIAGRPGQNGMNIGYYGSYIYWILEVVVVAGVAGSIIKSAASAPFCSECGAWKTIRQLGRVNVPRAAALEAITSGEINRLAGQNLAPGPGRLSLAAAVCPNCESLVPVDITFKEVTVDTKGAEQQSQIAHVTYPGQALMALEALFESDPKGVQPQPQPPPLPNSAPMRQAANRHQIVLCPLKPKDRDDMWRLEVDEEVAILVDSEGQVMATIPRDEAKARLVFPSFWESVRNLGILTDEGKVVWFKPDKAAIKEIKRDLTG